MRTYKLPVVWQMAGDVTVKANSLTKAIELAQKQPLPEGTFVTDSFEVVEDFIEHAEEEPIWFSTDELQWVKQENEDHYVVLETKYFPHNDQYVLQVRDIELDAYTTEEFEDAVSAYYKNLAEVQSQYGDSWKQIVAEVIAEQEPIDEEDPVFNSRKELFSHLEKEFGIKPADGDLIEEDTDEEDDKEDKVDEMVLKCAGCGHVHTSQENLWTEYAIQCPECKVWEEGANNRNLISFEVIKYLR